jgi:SulP family sulfate permease
MTFRDAWLPRSVTSLRTYSARRFSHDLAAGVTVGLVALPLAMAFGIASGVTPQAGLYTAVVAGFVISALGGSRVQIGGPTGAFVVIVAGIVARFGTSGLALVTLMAGGMLVLMGVTGLGSAVKFIPRPVILGFTNGIALLIASTQVKDFLGLKTGAVPSSFLPRMRMLAANIRTVDGPTVAIACATLAIIVLWPRVNRRIPGSILAVLICTAGAALLHLRVETVGTKFGGIPRGFPPLTLPPLHAEHILPLLAPALTVAMLGAIESLLSAVGGRWNGRRPAQQQCGTGSGGGSEPGIAAVWGDSSDRGHCADGDEYPVGRADAGIGNCARTDAAGDSAGCGSTGTLYPAGDTGRRSVCGGVEHGRMAGDWRCAEAG